MKNIDMETNRGIKVYSCTVERNWKYYLSVCDGIPITIEWEYDFNISEKQKRKIESSQDGFQSTVKVCMSKLLKNNFRDFKLLYNELKTNKSSKFFRDIQDIAEKEFQDVSIRTMELEHLLKDN